jgi:GAF domain-containing protein
LTVPDDRGGPITVPNVEARDVASLAEEQAALRRVATLVATESSPAEIFGAVTEEARRVIGSEAVGLLRFEPDDTAVLLAQSDTPWDPPPLGTRLPLDGENVVTQVLRTGQIARVDDWTESTGAVAGMAQVLGVRSAVAAPVVVEGGLWGTIIAATSRSQPLPAETESRIEQFTGLVATAIANAEARGALSRLVEEQAALRRVAVLVAQQPSPEEIFTAVAEAVGTLLGADMATLSMFSDEVAATVVASWSRQGPAVPLGTLVPLDSNTAVARIFHSGAAVRFDNHSPPSEIAETIGVRSVIGAPIVVGGKLWGVLGVAARGDNPLPEDAEARLAAFTELVATAVSNAQAREDLRRIADEQAALRHVATLVARGIGPEGVFRAVAGEVGALFGADVSAIVRFEDENTVTVLGDEGGPHDSGKRVSLDEGYVVHRVLATGRSARFDTDDPSAEDMPSLVRTLGIRSSVASPIVVDGELWGAITAASVEGALPAAAERRLTEFTDLVATAVSNAQAHVAVRKAADEQGALRRVATLVAASAAPSEVFAAVTAEIALVLGADACILCRADPDGAAVVVGTWAPKDAPAPALGTRIEKGGTNLVTIVLETGRSARIESYAEAAGDASEVARTHGLRSAVGAPILVEGRLWGLVVAGTTREDEKLPLDAEERLAGFTELVATAIANAQAQGDLTSLAERQAALRRVATLVARRATPEVVFERVAAEARDLLQADAAGLVRFEADNTVTVMAGPPPGPFATGERVPIDPTFVVHMVRETGLPARFETNDPAAEGMPEIVQQLGVRSAIASPILVEGALWGAVVLASSGKSFPLEMEQRLDEFTELVATGISNATARAELLASRVRIVAAGDEARRRIERNLHDGTQQRLVSLGIDLRVAEEAVPPESDDLRIRLSEIATGLAAALEDLQELSRGIHPATLSRGGLGPALRTLARRSAIPVDLDIQTEERVAAPIEVAAYFVASEALANAAKHSQASRIDVSLEHRERSLLLSIADDGVGGADSARGSGLVGLTDRVEALGGSIRITSRPGEGTHITAEFPRTFELP